MSTPDSIATFTTATKRQIRSFYHNRCAVCLLKLTEAGSQCAHILDSSGRGAFQVASLSQLGVIPHDYGRQLPTNGIVLCPTCHLGLLTFDHIAFSPPKQVLDYLLAYVRDTPRDNQMPLHQVLAKLVAGNTHAIPDPSLVLPYIGLYSMVHLKPDELEEVIIVTPALPPLSILHDNQWVPAPQATPTTQYVARIFDARALPAQGSDISLGFIPLYARHPQYYETRYWRLPKATLGGVLAAVMLRAMASPSEIDEELQTAKALYGLLLYQRSTSGVLAGGGSSGGGSSGGGSSGGGSSGGGSAGPSGGSGPSGGTRGRGKTQQKQAPPDPKPSQKAPGAADGRTTHSPEYNPQNWAFGPEMSTNTIVFNLTDTILDPTYYERWIFRPEATQSQTALCEHGSEISS